MQLIKWDEIRNKIEQSKDIEELSHLTDRLRAYKILAEQSKQSAEVQTRITNYLYRAERKRGEWLKENIKAGNPQLSQGGIIGKLKDLGVTPNESSRLQKLAAIPDKKFEEILTTAEVEVQKVTKNMLVNIGKEIERADNKKELKNKKIIMPDDVFDVIYADPPWQYRNSGFEMSAEKKYPTMSTNEICKMKTPNTNKNAVLFLWATNPMLEDALRVCKEWGFEYKTNMVWIKDRHTAGFYVFGQHELLFICIKGSMLPQGDKIKSIITGSNLKHSKKPEEVYSIIEKMYPNSKYIELFARNTRSGWSSYGNEAE